VDLHQSGIIPRLSDLFDSSRVDASDYAYSGLQTPDAFMMIGTIAPTAGLAATGGRDRAREQPWLPIATLAKTLHDSYVALKRGREEWRDKRALCAYRRAATLAPLAIAAPAVPEALRAACHLVANGRAGVAPAR
jgi:hypothetical protein